MSQLTHFCIPIVGCTVEATSKTESNLRLRAHNILCVLHVLHI
uniref:Uncharacterized protein n=1 Tax=Arundo donax TaxID=35708 RepID=A0A0A8YP37_ARUDO